MNPGMWHNLGGFGNPSLPFAHNYGTSSCNVHSGDPGVCQMGTYGPLSGPGPQTDYGPGSLGTGMCYTYPASSDTINNM